MRMRLGVCVDRGRVAWARFCIALRPVISEENSKDESFLKLRGETLMMCYGGVCVSFG
jgi:hypothetical protein